MRLTILGCSGTYPTPGRPTSGYLVEFEGARIWLDAGTGTFAALQTVTDLNLIDAVIISHVHADHCVDLLGFYYALRYGARPRLGIPAYVPEGLLERLEGFLGSPDIGETFDFRVLSEDGTARIGGIEVHVALTDHPVPTLAARLEAGGRVLAYSADTGAGGEWSRLAGGADLFLCEATYQGPSETKVYPHHLTAEEAGGLARRAAAESLMLTHIWPTLDPARSLVEAEATYDRPVRLAVPGMVVDV